MKSKTRETWKLLRKASGAYTCVEWWGEFERLWIGMTGLMSGCWAGVGRVTVSIWAGSLDPLWPFSGDWEDMKTQRVEREWRDQDPQETWQGFSNTATYDYGAG